LLHFNKRLKLPKINIRPSHHCELTAITRHTEYSYLSNNRDSDYYKMHQQIIFIMIFEKSCSLTSMMALIGIRASDEAYSTKRLKALTPPLMKKAMLSIMLNAGDSESPRTVLASLCSS
jgi:hypothetical protein